MSKNINILIFISYDFNSIKLSQYIFTDATNLPIFCESCGVWSQLIARCPLVQHFACKVNICIRYNL